MHLLHSTYYHSQVAIMAHTIQCLYHRDTNISNGHYSLNHISRTFIYCIVLAPFVYFTSPTLSYKTLKNLHKYTHIIWHRQIIADHWLYLCVVFAPITDPAVYQFFHPWHITCGPRCLSVLFHPWQHLWGVYQSCFTLGNTCEVFISPRMFV